MEQDKVQQLLENKLQVQAEKFHETYRPQMDALEKSLLAKVRPNGRLQVGDYYMLGKQLEQFDDYKRVCEEEGNLNLLGKIPQIAYDVITAVAGVSIIPIVAAVQPVDEERGTVYFKTIRGATTKGNVTKDQVLVDPRKNITTPTGYSSNFVTGETACTALGATVDYTFTLDNLPVRSETVKLTVESDANTYAIDDGRGNIVGKGLSGIINYDTGVCTVKFAVQPTIGKLVYAEYQVNPERSTDLTQIDTFFDSKAITARIYALKGTIGLLQSYGMRKRFGLVAEDELSKDLVSEINREIGGDIIRVLATTAVGNTNFDKTPPPNVSYFEHKQTFKDSMADAESVLIGNAGRGTISMMVAGRKAAAIISTLPGWTKLTDGTTLGTHVFGTLDGIVVVRTTEDALLAPEKVLVCWKGLSPFEAPVVYAPYMPLVVTSTLPVAPNPLQQMKAAAVWAGIDSLCPNFVTSLTVLHA